MSRLNKTCALAIIFLVVSGTAFAHQPRLVGDRPSIEVREPEISQAFYARLAGKPQTYTIRSEVPLRLYVNVLVPDLPETDTDYEAVITRVAGQQDEILARLDGKACEWRPFHEPFGGDDYLLGPEYDERVPAGTYVIVVRSPDNLGKYVLAVGKVEKFPLREMARTVVALPKLKKYFGKSPWTAFFNRSGLFLLIATGAIGVLAAVLVHMVRRLRRRADRA